MKRAVIVSLAVLALVACKGKSKGKGQAVSPDEPVEAKPIGETGAIIDAPKSWVVSADGRISFRVGLGPGRQVFLVEAAFPPATPDELYTKECAGASAPGTKETLPNGAVFVQCQVPTTTQDGKSVELTKIAATVRTAKGGVKCHVTTTRDAPAFATICRTLRATATPGSGSAARVTVPGEGGS